ncbi:unnamed protein product [Symbiodinium pilosum]|uniref:Uncharacterized protein n=1 Tax=Symbiodinium pilosum TaxID=2952 RepID=A0A812TUJ4_SYMPI|nr:unnamed protein product [Symbiodinium pilosum]
MSLPYEQVASGLNEMPVARSIVKRTLSVHVLDVRSRTVIEKHLHALHIEFETHPLKRSPAVQLIPLIHIGTFLDKKRHHIPSASSEVSPRREGSPKCSLDALCVALKELPHNILMTSITSIPQGAAKKLVRVSMALHVGPEVDETLNKDRRALTSSAVECTESSWAFAIYVCTQLHKFGHDCW